MGTRTGLEGLCGQRLTKNVNFVSSGTRFLDFNVVKVETRQGVKTFAPDEVPTMVIAKMKKNALVFDPGGGC